MQSHQPTLFVDLTPIQNAIRRFDPHGTLLVHIHTHVRQPQELVDLAQLFATDYKVEEGDALGNFLHVARPWLTDKSFKIIVEHMTQASQVMPAFFKQCELQLFHEKPEKYADIPDILMTLCYMAKVGVRLDKHNSKIAFINPSLGRAYQLCERQGFISRDKQPLGMSEIEVLRHLSQCPDLARYLLELAYIDELLILMKMPSAQQNYRSDIKSLFDCTLEEPESASLCLGFFPRRAARIPVLTLDEQMVQIRNKYGIGEYPHKTHGL